MLLKKSLPVCLVFVSIMTAGCSHHEHQPEGRVTSNHDMSPSATDSRLSLGLDADAQQSLNAVMREHLEAVHQIVEALGKNNFQKAKDVTENELGMAKHRVAMRGQMPRDFPPQYHDLAMAHHHAAEALATTIPSKNLSRILPALAKTVEVCVACHRAYKR